MLPNRCFLSAACSFLDRPLALRGVARLNEIEFCLAYSVAVLSVSFPGVCGPGVRGGNSPTRPLLVALDLDSVSDGDF